MFYTEGSKKEEKKERNNNKNIMSDKMWGCFRGRAATVADISKVTILNKTIFGCVWTKARSTSVLPVWHCRRTLKDSPEQNYLFVWDSCLRWFMVVNNKNIAHSKSRLSRN